MKTQLLLLAMISLSVNALTATNECDCTEIVQSADCKGGCTWSSADSSCSAKTVDCTTYTTQPTCDAVNTCAWNDTTSKCATFTACADYTVTTSAQCYAKDSTCVPGTTGTDGKTPCKTGSVTCSSFSNAADCNFKSPSSNAVCWFKASTCSQIDVSKCSTITDQDVCTLLCKWTSAGACAANTCADMTTAEACDTVSTDDFSGVNICSWNSSTSKCGDAADVSALTSANCFDKTAGYYYWDGSACSECSGSSSNGYILAFIGFIAMLMF
ncbi:unnamed protein product (macronuclear) [Paramecium tetraurelia]|uniref:Uncharacterized protein n=1 Tax=Paramecium tetraurelia TaxID=5888 RepID=A0CPM2_PARTE|nr:uncharacterized protein GSPATT00009131001 [Paramecium tetraurelia]CAK72739.1 unnamed protein product [Paramecium tetraurelia]|eukprot:XP_001440136.1 hypothetical protein (macronuclear) [Paramecium tetraurelia strain d4-2]